MVKELLNTDELSFGVYVQNHKSSPFKPFSSTSHLFLTQKGNNSLKEEILKQIRGAKQVLKICSFIVTDKQINEALIERAKEGKVAIFILTQLDQSKLKNDSLLEDFLTKEEIEDNSNQNHLSCIKKLFDQGVHVRASTTAHAKFIISDRNIGFITSANLTTPSLSLNTESGVYLNSNDATELDRLFDIVFQKGTKYRQYITASRKKTFVIQAEGIVDKSILPLPNTSKLRYTYEDLSSNLYEEIIHVIEAANEYLFLSAYSIVALQSLPELILALKAAKKRNVSINIFCRGMNYRSDHLEGSAILKDIGCNIFGDVYNHSKGIVNELTGLLFTANFDGNHGLKNGFEVGCVLDENQRCEFLDFHKHIIESSVYTYEAKPKRLDFFETYKAYELEKKIIPPLIPDEITILIKGNFNSFLEELGSMPIFYSKIQGSNCTLFAGTHGYRATYKDGTFELLDSLSSNLKSEKYLLKFKTLKIING